MIPFILATDARVLNSLANNPSILPYIAPEGTESLDFSVCHFNGDRTDRIRFYHNAEETIGMLFKWTSPDVWELHMLATPECRGSTAYPFAVSVITDMFEQHGAETIWGYTPKWNERARAMHSKVGGISKGFGVHPVFGDVELFSTPRDQWKPVEPKYDVTIKSKSEVTNG